jgi:hypothetical protein
MRGIGGILFWRLTPALAGMRPRARLSVGRPRAPELMTRSMALAKAPPSGKEKAAGF